MQRLTRAEFARLMDVNRSTVTRWIDSGRVEVGDDGKIDPQAAHNLLEATESPEPHHMARKAQIDDEKAQAAAHRPNEGQSMPALEKLGAHLKYETYKLRKADAEIRTMERDKLAGTLGESASFEYVMRDIAISLRGLLESMPDRLSPTIAAHRGDVTAIHAALSDAAHDLLNEINDIMKRKAEQSAP